MEPYDSISHLVRSARVSEETVEFDFCSDCGEFQATVTVTRQDQDDPSPRKRLAGWFRSSLRQALGPSPENTDLGEEERERLTCHAFEQIKGRLTRVQDRWHRQSNKEHPSDLFDSQLRSNPIVEKYDVEILVRVLVEVSRSDSDLRTEERAFLEEIVQDEETIKRLEQAPNVTVAELAETSSVAVRETILMLAWAMAYADGRLDAEEMLRLNQLCRGFMLPQNRVMELQMAAKLFLLDRHFQYLKCQDSECNLKIEFEKKAKEWGVDDQQLETLRSWYPEELS